MYLEIAAGSYLLGSYIYHRWFAEDPPKPKPTRDISIPRTDDGATIPLIFGRCRIRSPWLAWAGPVVAFTDDVSSEADLIGAPFHYTLDLFYVLGVGFYADADNRLRHVYVDDMKLSPGSDLQGVFSTGAFEFGTIDNSVGDNDEIVGTVGSNFEFLPGASSQLLCDDTTPFTSVTFAGDRMADAIGTGQLVPGYRGYLSVFLTNAGAVIPAPSSTRVVVPSDAAGEPMGWRIGNDSRPGAYSFEAHSYPAAGDQFGTSTKIGEEANPADIIRNIFVGKFGKLALPSTVIDEDSFAAVAATLEAEGMGYSRAFDDGATAETILEEICKHIDGVWYQDPSDGKIHLKLIRNDYDPDGVPIINPDNAECPQDYAIRGLTGIVNKVRVVFKDRSQDYRDNSATSQNHANAVGQDNQIIEQVLQFPGCCTADLAETFAGRELGYVSRPIAKCRVNVARSFYPTVTGDVVRLVWPEWGVDKYFRVANVQRGTLRDSKITLWLVEDVFRSTGGSFVDSGGQVGSFPVVVDP